MGGEEFCIPTPPMGIEIYSIEQNQFNLEDFVSLTLPWEIEIDFIGPNQVNFFSFFFIYFYTLIHEKINCTKNQNNSPLIAQMRGKGQL